MAEIGKLSVRFDIGGQSFEVLVTGCTVSYAKGGIIGGVVWTRIDDEPSRVTLEPRTGFTPQSATRARAEAEVELNEAIGQGGIGFAAIQEAEAARRA